MFGANGFLGVAVLVCMARVGCRGRHGSRKLRQYLILDFKKVVYIRGQLRSEMLSPLQKLSADVAFPTWERKVRMKKEWATP